MSPFSVHSSHPPQTADYLNALVSEATPPAPPFSVQRATDAECDAYTARCAVIGVRSIVRIASLCVLPYAISFLCGFKRGLMPFVAPLTAAGTRLLSTRLGSCSGADGVR